MATTIRSRQSEPSKTCRLDMDNIPLQTETIWPRPELLVFNEVPYWSQDNKHILSGYRSQSNSVTACLSSWTYLHNETINIYSHLFPAVGFIGVEVLLYQHFETLYPEATWTDRMVFTFFLLTAIVCLGLSTAYHTLNSHSASVSALWLRFDYVGILGLILGNIVSGTYVIFYCEPGLRSFYWTMTFTLSLLTCVILLNPKFQGREYRSTRAITFVCTGLSALAPLTHAAMIFGIPKMMEQSGLPYYLLEGFLHIVGVFFYATRIPESLSPGNFDVWFSSHQIFHVLVVLATVSQLLGIWTAFDYQYTNKVCTQPQPWSS